MLLKNASEASPQTDEASAPTVGGERTPAAAPLRREAARLCVNGHEYVKRQLAKRGVAFEALDNGILSCADPALAQRLADGLDAEKIDDLVLRGSSACRTRSRATTGRRGSARRSPSCLPEFALTQVLDRPVQGRACSSRR